MQRTLKNGGSAYASLLDGLPVEALLVQLELLRGRVPRLVELASELVESGRWTPEDVQADALPQRYRFVRSPAQLRARGTA